MHDKGVYGDVCFIENPSKNQKSSKVNMKSTICHDFPSPDLLEGPKEGKIKENAVFFIVESSNRIYSIFTLLNTNYTLSLVNE